MPSRTKKKEEPSLRDQLLADYDKMEKSIEEASQAELWELADWLAEFVPERRAGRRSGNSEADFAIITLDDLAAEGHRTKRWLQMLRKVAKDTEEGRLAEVSPSTYLDVLKKHGGDLTKANEALRKKGNKRRDHRSGEGVKGIIKALAQKSQEDKEQVARAIYQQIGPVKIIDDEEDIDDDIDDEEDREPGPFHENESGSKTLRESYASCVTPTVDSHIDAIEGALKYLFETDMYELSGSDKTRLRTMLKKGLKALNG